MIWLQNDICFLRDFCFFFIATFPDLYLSSWIIQNQRFLPDSVLQHRPKSNCCFAHSWPTPDPSLHITSVLCTEFLSGPRQVLRKYLSPEAILKKVRYHRGINSRNLEFSFVGRFWVTCRVLSCLFYGITGKW